MIVVLGVALLVSGGGTPATAAALDLRAEHVLVLPDGRVVIAGVSERERGGEGLRGCDGELAVVRLDHRGGLDAGFGDGGSAHVRPDGRGCVSAVNPPVLEPDGHMLVGMTIFHPPDSVMEHNSAQTGDLIRLTSLGQVDDAFNPEPSGFRFAVSPDGSIFDEHGARYLPNGAPAGELVPVAVDLAVDVAAQPDGKKLFLGLKDRRNHRRIAVQRFDPDWNPDTTFGTDGIATADVAPGRRLEPLQPSPQRVLPAADGALIVFARAFGPRRTYASAIKFDASGRLDRTFGDHGRVEIGPPHRTKEVYDLTVQPDGGLVAIGSSAPGGARRFFVASYRPDGRPDRRFGRAGRVTLDLPRALRGLGRRRLNRGSRTGAITAASDGTYVGVASVAKLNGTAPRSLAFRLRPDGALDPSFGQGGVKLLRLRRTS